MKDEINKTIEAIEALSNLGEMHCDVRHVDDDTTIIPVPELKALAAELKEQYRKVDDLKLRNRFLCDRIYLPHELNAAARAEIERLTAENVTLFAVLEYRRVFDAMDMGTSETSIDDIFAKIQRMIQDIATIGGADKEQK